MGGSELCINHSGTRTELIREERVVAPTVGMQQRKRPGPSAGPTIVDPLTHTGQSPAEQTCSNNQEMISL